MKVEEIALEAMRIFNENKDTLVATYLVRNPEVKIEDIVLCQGIQDGNLAIWIELK